jgi:hypothetical protein
VTAAPTAAFWLALCGIDLVKAVRILFLTLLLSHTQLIGLGPACGSPPSLHGRLAGVISSNTLVAPGQQSSTSTSTAEDNSSSSPTSFEYKFENPRFYVPLIQIEIDPAGSGQLRFKRGESDDVIDRKLKLLPSTMALLGELVGRTRFLASKEEYQNKKDFSHLGWVTLTARRGQQERTVRFNYTSNADVSELATIFRAIADQEIAVFDLELAVQNEPLDLPSVLETLENDLREGHFVEPQSLVKPLEILAQEDSLPLIARNQAARLVAAIEKGKFKPPFKLEK